VEQREHTTSKQKDLHIGNKAWRKNTGRLTGGQGGSGCPTALEFDIWIA